MARKRPGVHDISTDLAVTQGHIWLVDDVKSESVQRVCELLDMADRIPNRTICLFLNTAGGSVYDGFGLMEIMGALRNDIAVLAFGQAMSMGSLVVPAGTRGLRCALPRTRFLFHPASSEVSGDSQYLKAWTQDLNWQEDQCLRYWERYSRFKNENDAANDDPKRVTIHNALKRMLHQRKEHFSTPEEVRDRFGLLDHVVQSMAAFKAKVNQHERRKKERKLKRENGV